MKKGRWYLVFIFEDKLAHTNKRWITREEYVLLKAQNPEAAQKKVSAAGKKRKVENIFHKSLTKKDLSIRGLSAIYKNNPHRLVYDGG